MSAAPSGPDDGYGDVRDDPSEGPVDAGDLLDDPRTDVEALCLCSLLWSSSPVARTITDALTPGDFERPVYRDLFGLIAGQVEVGKPHDPASVAAALTQTGRAAGHRGTQLSRALSDATMAGGAPEAVGHYAITVGRPPMINDQRLPSSSAIQPTSGPPMTVVPSQASAHRAISRPRIDGSEASCRVVLA